MTKVDEDESALMRSQQEDVANIKRIGIEYQYGCYEEKLPELCHMLGMYRETIEKNLAAAHILFRDNCENSQHARSCYKYGRMLLAGTPDITNSYVGCPVDDTKAKRAFEVGCNGNMPFACRYLAQMHWHGLPADSDGIKRPDTAAAERYMTKACELEDAEACWRLSAWYVGPQVPTRTINRDGSILDPKKTAENEQRLPSNMALAFKYAQRCCTYAMPQCCANVALMYRFGDGVPKDETKAKEYEALTKDLLDRSEMPPLVTG